MLIAIITIIMATTVINIIMRLTRTTHSVVGQRKV